MAIKLDPTTVNAANEANLAPATPPAARAAAKPASTPLSTPFAATPEPPAVQAATLQANVTFRRDPKGQIYFVLTDAQSGKEIREVPPAEIRKVGEGIEDYLKQEEAKTTSKLDSKA
jgi:hypothetical protein